MGRHSASYIAAQQTPPARPAAGGAARYVGRVGALAFAMGVGAAVIGGAGLANAEGTSDGSAKDGASAGAASSAAAPSGDTGVPSPAGPTSDAGTTPDADAPTAAATGVKTRKPSLLDVPKMVFAGGVAKHRPAAATVGEVPDQDALPASDAETPEPIDPADTGADADADPPTGGHTTPLAGTRHSGRPHRDAPKTEPSTSVDATTSVAAKAVDDETPTPAVTGSPRLTESVVTSAGAVTSLAVPATVSPIKPAARVSNPVATLVSGFLNALGLAPTATTPVAPPTPFPILTAVLQLIHREIDNFVTNFHAAQAYYTSSLVHVTPANATTTPLPGDETSTAYGDIGKWMLEPGGQISDYGGDPYHGKTVLEAVNVIIVDPNSTTPQQAAARLNTAMFWSGFPAQLIHSTGFQGKIDDVVYGQQPTGLLQGYSDNFFLLTNDHGRIFGPDPVQTSTGYVWSGAFSTEALTIFNFLPAHAYVSSDSARTALAMHLILSGQATYVGMVPLDNAVNTSTTTTGDHDGYAVVLKLR
jgi:hypothetical protein